MPESEAPQFIKEVMALGANNVQRASALGVHINTIRTMTRTGKIPKCVARYLRYPNIVAALHRDALAYVAHNPADTAS